MPVKNLVAWKSIVSVSKQGSHVQIYANALIGIFWMILLIFSHNTKEYYELNKKKIGSAIEVKEEDIPDANSFFCKDMIPFSNF